MIKLTNCSCFRETVLTVLNFKRGSYFHQLKHSFEVTSLPSFVMLVNFLFIITCCSENNLWSAGSSTLPSRQGWFLFYAYLQVKFKLDRALQQRFQLASIRNGFPDETVDHYDRPLKEFWFKFSSRPSYDAAESFITYPDQLVGIESRARRRLMSPFPLSEATASKPFVSSLNASLVVCGFCHVFTQFCQDEHLLELQATAKENQMGPIWWCGISL